MDKTIVIGIAGSAFLLLYIWWVVKLHGAEAQTGTAAPEKRDPPGPTAPDPSGTSVHAYRAGSAPGRCAPAPAAKPVPARTKARPVPVAKPKKAAPAKAKPSATKSKKTTAAKPKRAPRTTRSKDELQRINGIGPKIDGQLKAMKITTFAQIAAFKKADIAQVNEKLKFKGRIEREQWVAQAKLLAAGKEAAFEKKFGKGTKTA